MATELIISGVTSRIRLQYPHSTDVWTDNTIQRAAHMADMIVKEQAETLWAEIEIDLVADAIYYDLPRGCIWVGGAVFASDGATYKDQTLLPTTYEELDAFHPNWHDQRGTKPTRYLLLSAPGVESYSKIMLWPALSSRTTETVKVKYLACLPDLNLSMTASQISEWAVDQIYTPLTAAILLGVARPDEAQALIEAALEKMPKLRAEYQSKYGDFWPVMSE